MRSCGPTHSKWIPGAAGNGERAYDREAVVTKIPAAYIQRSRSEGQRSYPGRSRLVPEGVTTAAMPAAREVSSGRSSEREVPEREGPNVSRRVVEAIWWNRGGRKRKGSR